MSGAVRKAGYGREGIDAVGTEPAAWAPAYGVRLGEGEWRIGYGQLFGTGDHKGLLHVNTDEFIFSSLRSNPCTDQRQNPCRALFTHGLASNLFPDVRRWMRESEAPA
jgi:hypothetical protein